jgi:Holliday junction resolvase RusA-like endonuclease
MIAVTLQTLPLSTNNLYANGRKGRFLTTAGRTNKEDMGWEARSQYHGEPLSGPLRLTVALYWPDKRNRDIDNIKGLLDSLTGILWEDDGLIEDLHIRKFRDKARPRVELELFALAGDKNPPVGML